MRGGWSIIYLVLLLRIVSGQLHCVTNGFQRVEDSESFTSLGLLLGLGTGENLNWGDSRQACQDLTAEYSDLVIFRDVETRDTSASIYSGILSTFGIWIGTYQKNKDDEPAGNWFWVDDVPMLPTSDRPWFYQGEPSNDFGAEDCGSIHFTGNVNDWNCENNAHRICEVSVTACSSQSECIQGAFWNSGSGTCTPCPDGSYTATSGLTACLSCTVGKKSRFTSFSTSCVDCIVGSERCIECTAGKYQLGSICENCPAGKYSAVPGALSIEECSNCATGLYASEGSTQCTSCPEGRFSYTSRSTSVDQCEYCDGADNDCSCPCGWIQNTDKTRCLKLFSEKKSFYSAWSSCFAEGGDLMTIREIVDLSIITPMLIDESVTLFFGMFQDVDIVETSVDGKWTWIQPDGIAFNRIPWGADKPDDINNSGCLVLYYNSSDWVFDDQSCQSSHSFVCEIACEVPTVFDTTGAPIPEWNQVLTLTAVGNTALSLSEIRAFNETIGRPEPIIHVIMSSTMTGAGHLNCYDGDTSTICSTNEGIGQKIMAYFYGRVSLVQIRGLGAGIVSLTLENKRGEILAEEEISSDFTLSMCSAGTFVPIDNSVFGCSVCTAGKFSSANSNECNDCIAGKFSLRESSSCTECSAGKFSITAASSCTNCAAGFFGNGTGLSECFECVTGFFSLEGADHCDACLTGKYGTESGASKCEECTAGRFANETGMEECHECSFGTFSAASASECTLCEQGRYENTSGSTACKFCPSGKSSIQVGAVSEDVCEDCGIGSFSVSPNTGACQHCPIGSFQNSTGSSSCIPCPGNFSTSAVGSTSESDCGLCAPGFYKIGEDGLRCAGCVPGKYGVGEKLTSSDDCQVCPQGKYSSNTGQSACTDCPLELTTDGVGATDLVDCSECALGSYRDSTSNLCTACPIGTYASESGLVGIESCTNCPFGRYSNSTAEKFVESCLECPIGTYGGALGSPECSLCPAGKYGSEAAQQSEGSCTSCPVGRFSISEGGEGVDSCQLCGLGTFISTEGQTSCQSCPLGTFGTAEGAASIEECINCPVGRYGDTLASQLESSCKECQVGSFASSTGLTECELCVAGRYGTNTGSTVPSDCLPCFSGKYSTEEGGQYAESCSNCAVGSYTSTTGSTSCSLCPSGKYGDDEGSSSLNGCKSCPVGRFSEDEGGQLMESCVLCRAGTYNELTSQTSCTGCPPGRFLLDTGSISRSACDLCPAGTFGSSFGVSSVDGCSLCVPGKYSAQLGQVNCLNCPIGRYGDVFGGLNLTSCPLCPAGRYSDTTGVQFADGCKLCPEGTYLDTKGATASSNCIKCLTSAGIACPAGSSFPFIRHGYYWDSRDPESIIRCFPADSCRASSSGMTECAAGFEGPGCTQCINKEYYRLQDTCASCNASWVRILTMIFLAFCVFMLIYRFVNSKTGRGLDIRLGLNFIQIMVTYPKLSENWGSIIAGFFQGASISNVNFQLLGMSCYLDASFWVNWHIKLLFPFFFAFVLGCVHVTSILLQRSYYPLWNVSKDKYISFFMLIISAFYISIVSTVTEPLNCIKQFDGSYAMLSDMSITCYEAEWNEQIPAIAIYIVLYFALCPLFVVYVLLKAFMNDKLLSEDFISRYGSLTRLYDHTYFYWEVISMLKKCLIVSVADFLSTSTSSTLRIVCVLLILMAIGAAEVLLQPYRNKAMNRLNYLWTTTSVLFLVGSFVYESEDATEVETSLFTTFLLLLFALSTVMSILMLVRRLYSGRSDQSREADVENDRQLGLATDAFLHLTRVTQSRLLWNLNTLFHENGMELDMEGLRRFGDAFNMVSSIETDPTQSPIRDIDSSMMDNDSSNEKWNERGFKTITGVVSIDIGQNDPEVLVCQSSDGILESLEEKENDKD